MKAARKLQIVVVLLLSIAVVGYVLHVRYERERHISEWVDPWK